MRGAVSSLALCPVVSCAISGSFGHFRVISGSCTALIIRGMLITMHPASEARSTTTNNYRRYCPNNNSLLVNNTLGYCGGSGGYEALLLSAFLPPAFLLPIGSNTLRAPASPAT